MSPRAARIRRAAGLAATLPALLLASCGRGSPDHEEILATVRAYDAAWNRRDSTAVAAALAPEYVYFSSTGRVVTRDGTLEFLRSPQYRLDEADRSEIRVTHASPEAAIVSSRWRGRGTWQGETFRDDQRCSLVVRWSGAEWQLLSEHCTQITDPSGAEPEPTAEPAGGAAPASAPSARCYESDRSAFGERTVDAGPGALRGWLRLEDASADSGGALVLDPDGASLQARWRRLAGDSVVVTGFDDFLRLEYRLALHPGRASGPAVLTSDAELARDEQGAPSDLRREWAFRAREVACSELPGNGAEPSP